MEIKYFGHAAFRLKGKTGIIVCDPFDPEEVGLKFPKDVLANAVTVSHNHSDHNRTDLISGSPVVIVGPGEYEVSGIKIYGYSVFHDAENGKKRGKNTIYLFKIDKISVLHLGDLGHKLDDKMIDEIGNVDIVLIPTGGIYTLDAKEASEVVRQIEPRIVIPMHYKKEGMSSRFDSLQTVDIFQKEMGKETFTYDKLTMTSDKLPQETTVIIL